MNHSPRRLRWAAPTLAAGLLAAWETAARMEWIPTLFFPSPLLIAATVGKLTQSGELPAHFGTTVSRMLLALAFGGSVGLVLGMALGWAPRLRAVIDPFIAVLHPVPRMSLLPIIMLVFGVGFFSKVLVVALSAFFPMAINSMAGVRHIDPNYFDVAEVYGATRRRVFTRVVMPGSLPMILTGVRLAMIASLGATIGVELITAQTGLGSMIFFAWQTLRTEELYATVFVIGALGYFTRAMVNRITLKMVPWQGESRGR